MYKRFVESYEDADATLASPAGDLVHQFQAMVTELADSLETYHQQADCDEIELDRLRDAVGSVRPSSSSSSSRRMTASMVSEHYYL